MLSSRKELESRLTARKEELSARLERVSDNHRRVLSSDSKERATEMENSEVVDALGNDAREELAQITDALHRLSVGTYGTCVDCAQTIGEERLAVHPYARRCIDCAETDERGHAQV